MAAFEMCEEDLLLFYALWEVSKTKYDSLCIVGNGI